MTFSLYQRGVVNYATSQITHAQLSSSFLLAHALGRWALISVVAPILLIYQISLYISNLFIDVKPSQRGRTVPNNTENKEKWCTNTIIYICTTVLHYFLSVEHCRAASIISLMQQATNTPSIHSNLGQARARTPLAITINTNCDLILKRQFFLYYAN